MGNFLEEKRPLHKECQGKEKYKILRLSKCLLDKKWDEEKSFSKV
jgi:hypothetical protein